ncbi:MAG TPA: cysteine desulfurase [Chloroflexota bacterium]|nr:cysteine desulfurase [Chloroflexota bacterium]
MAQAQTATLDTSAIRQDFPILSRLIHGRPLVYLDNAATSQKPQAVIDSLVEYYRDYNANVHRGVHLLSDLATDGYEGARAKVARFIKAPEARSVVFTRNTTESINLVAYAWAGHHLKAGDEIVVSEMEHHSNLVPWQIIASARGVAIKAIPLTAEGELDLTDLDQIITERTRLVAVTHMSNVLGTINPVRVIADRAHAVGALMLVDGAQSAPHFPVDVVELDCDFYAFSSHKMLGPTGMGVLYGRAEILDGMAPFMGGGSMISAVWLDHSTWNEIPHRFEAGTPNIADAIGLGTAVDYLEALGMANVRQHEIEVTTYALERLRAESDVTIFGPSDLRNRGGVVSFNVRDIHPHDVATILDGEGIAIRAGHHCCHPLHRHLGVAATNRASFYVYNTFDEVDRLIEGLKKVREVFGS